MTEFCLYLHIDGRNGTQPYASSCKDGNKQKTDSPLYVGTKNKKQSKTKYGIKTKHKFIGISERKGGVRLHRETS